MTSASGLQLLLFSHVYLVATPWTAACQASLSITDSRSLLKLMSTDSVVPFNHLILCHPLLLLPSMFPSRVFTNELALCSRWPKFWSFSVSPSNEYSGLISFRIDCSDLLAVQSTLKSLFQHHSSKTSILWRSTFYMVQFSHPSIHDYWKNHHLLDLHVIYKKLIYSYLNCSSFFQLHICVRQDFPHVFQPKQYTATD